MRTRRTGVSSAAAGTSTFASNVTLSVSDTIVSVSASEDSTSASEWFASVDLDDLDAADLVDLASADLDGGLDVEAARVFPLVLGACTCSTTSAFASSSPESEFSGMASTAFFDRARETVRVFLAWGLGGAGAGTSVGGDESFLE